MINFLTFFQFFLALVTRRTLSAKVIDYRNKLTHGSSKSVHNDNLFAVYEPTTDATALHIIKNWLR